ALLDNPPIIRINGLKDKQKVTLWNTFTDDSGIEFSSHAHYIADAKGDVDLVKDPSYGGKYKGVFTEGLVSSLHSAPPSYAKKPQLKWARLHKKFVDSPMKYTLNVFDGHVSEEEIYSDKRPVSLGESIFLRHLMADGVRRVEVSEGNLRGVLFLPPGDGPFPVVMDLFGAESGIKEFRSAMLASYGYASFVVPYYNYKDLPPLKDTIDLNYFLEAVDYASSIPEGNNGKIGIIGSSKGGEIGLTLTSLSDKIKACVSINSYHKSIDIDYYLDNKLFLERKIGSPKEANVYVTKEGFLMAFGKQPFYKWDIHHILPIDKTHDDCHVLIAAGDDDGGHSHRSAITLKERARRFGKKNITTVVYPGTGHLLDPPFHSHIVAVWNSTLMVRKKDGTRYKGLPHYYGGTPYHVCQSTKDLWRRTLALFYQRLVLDSGLPLDSAKLYPPY
ncbi:UNVERIFIED_CONTAM: hypothetical protein GTU68_017518, partial [Idotea baltica]|nr:hypothetical protein [Idotea baltica]